MGFTSSKNCCGISDEIRNNSFTDVLVLTSSTLLFHTQQYILLVREWASFESLFRKGEIEISRASNVAGFGGLGRNPLAHPLFWAAVLNS